jgi:hypothetical protein
VAATRWTTVRTSLATETLPAAITSGLGRPTTPRPWPARPMLRPLRFPARRCPKAACSVLVRWIRCPGTSRSSSPKGRAHPRASPRTTRSGSKTGYPPARPGSRFAASLFPGGVTRRQPPPAARSGNEGGPCASTSRRVLRRTHPNIEARGSRPSIGTRAGVGSATVWSSSMMAASSCRTATSSRPRTTVGRRPSPPAE